MNKECDYSAAYIDIETDTGLRGQGMTFSELVENNLTPAIGRGNDIVCYAVEQVANRIVGMDVEEMFADMGKFFDYRECTLQQD